MYQQNFNFPQNQLRQLPYLKGRPVSSIEEAQAFPIDFDGSIFYFPNLANDKIYTKQINLDGTSSVRVYEQVDVKTPEFITREEFQNTIQSLIQQLNQQTPKEKVNCNF